MTDLSDYATNPDRVPIREMDMVSAYPTATQYLTTNEEATGGVVPDREPYTYFMRPEGASAEHHDTGAQPGRYNYTLDVHNADDVLTDRFYLYDARTELLEALETACVFTSRRGVTVTITRLDLEVPQHEDPVFPPEDTNEQEEGTGTEAA